MNISHLRLTIAMLSAVGVSSAYADPIPVVHVTEVTVNMGQNRIGDNINFEFTGPGLDIKGFGGMGCFSWCSGDPIAPDTPTLTSRVFIANFATPVTVGGMKFDFLGQTEFGFFDDFGGLNHVVDAFADSTEFTFIMPTTGGWTLNFIPVVDQNGNPALSFTNGTFFASAPLQPTPEPATVGLVLAGSAGLYLTFGARRRRIAVSHAMPVPMRTIDAGSGVAETPCRL